MVLEGGDCHSSCAFVADDFASALRSTPRTRGFSSPLLICLLQFPALAKKLPLIRACMVLGGGFEPPRITPHGPQPCASANSATRAYPSIWFQGKRYIFSPHVGIYAAGAVRVFPAEVYDMNPANLNKLSPADSSVRYVNMMGGADNILKTQHYYPSLSLPVPKHPYR